MIRSVGVGSVASNNDGDNRYDDRSPLLSPLSLSQSDADYNPSPRTPPKKWRWWVRLIALSTLLSSFLYLLPGFFLEFCFFPARGRMFPGGLNSLIFAPDDPSTAVSVSTQQDQESDVQSYDVHIPRIVHVTYKSREELPPDWENSLRRWEELHPNWTLRFWSDDDISEFVHLEYPELEALHQSYKYTIQRVDSVRYMILLKYGGVYSDMDISPNNNVNLDPLLEMWERDGKSVLLAETFNAGVTNAFMAAAPGSNFMKCAVANLPRYKRRWYHFIGWRHWEVLSSAGSTYLWGMVGHCDAGRGNGDRGGGSEVRILAARSFRRCSVCDTTAREAASVESNSPCDTEWLRHSSTNSSWHQSMSWYHAAWFKLAYSLFCRPFSACFLISTIFLGFVNQRRDRRRLLNKSS